VLSVLGAGGYLYFRLDDEIRRQVEARFASHYREFDVKVGRARFDPDRGIAIDNFRLTPKTADGSPAEPILSIDEMYLAGHVRIEQLLTNQLQIDAIVIRRANLRLVRQGDGRWNVSALLPLPHFSDQAPKITIEDAASSLVDAAHPAAKPWSLQGIHLELAPLAAGAEQLNGHKQYHIAGSASGLPAREIRILGELGTTSGELDVAVTTTGLDISPELLAILPMPATEQLKGAQATGLADITLHLVRPDSRAPLRWSARFKMDRGRFAHQALPDPLTDVTIVGQADPQRLVIERMSCKCGPASIALAANRAGWGANAPLAMSARIIGFPLTERWEKVLPESHARTWSRFRPIGPIDAEMQLTFDGQAWKPVVTAECRGISLTDRLKFPYVLEQTSGRVIYRAAENGNPDQLRLDLTGIGGGQPVKIDAVLTHLAPAEPQGISTGEGVAANMPQKMYGIRAAGYRGAGYAGGRAARSHPLGYVEISGSDIPLHDRLLAALPPKAKSFVSDLNAHGAVDFRFRAEWTDLAQPIANTTLDIPLKDCRIQYARFRLPLQHVQGVAKGHIGSDALWHWALDNIEARGNYDATVVKCRGGVVPHDSGIEADLTFEATNVPLDDTLRLALPAGGQRAWTELNPQGSIDFTAHITQQPNELEPNVEVGLRPCKGTVAIQPRMFFYRLEKLEGTATYQRGRVDWRNIIGRHDRSVYSVESGSWQLTGDGGWKCSFGNVNVDRLVTSRDFVAALPAGLQAVIEKLQPSGSIGLYKGNLTFIQSPQSEAIAAEWDISLECQQVAIRGAVPIEGINGGIRLLGRSDGRTAFGTGEMALDSMLWKNMQLTNVRGPFWADATQCLIGEPASVLQNQQPRRLTADAYGGSLSSNIALAHGPSPGFQIDLHLGAANLGRFANERLGGPRDMNGTVSGTLVLTGSGSSTQTLRGKGELHVVDANIYELTPLVAMLKVLRNRTPNTTAFNRCDMDFTIQGEHVHFQHLNLLGDAVSLYGTGETDFNRRLNLVFYTLIGPADLPIPLWKTIAGHVSQQGLQLKVVGTFDDPKIERKPFPAVNDMLDQLQTGIQDGAATIAPAASSRAAPSATR
jgi:hypothetical protein